MQAKSQSPRLIMHRGKKNSTAFSSIANHDYHQTIHLGANNLLSALPRAFYGQK